MSSEKSCDDYESICEKCEHFSDRVSYFCNICNSELTIECNCVAIVWCQSLDCICKECVIKYEDIICEKCGKKINNYLSKRNSKILIEDSGDILCYDDCLPKYHLNLSCCPYGNCDYCPSR